MKSSTILYGLQALSLLLIIYLFFELKNGGEAAPEPPAVVAATPEAEEEEEEHFELAVAMGHLQRYSAKLHYAGVAENQDLANFYLHEMEEVMEEVVEAKVVDDGMPISNLMESMGVETVSKLQAHILSEGLSDFGTRYENLINTCNNCHIASKHGFIRITVPEGEAPYNQNFAPLD